MDDCSGCGSVRALVSHHADLPPPVHHRGVNRVFRARGGGNVSIPMAAPLVHSGRRRPCRTGRAPTDVLLRRPEGRDVRRRVGGSRRTRGHLLGE